MPSCTKPQIPGTSRSSAPSTMWQFEVPMMMFDPTGQQEVVLPRTAVTSWVASATLPAASRAVQVTFVVPSGNLDGALFVIVTPHRSVACA